VTADNSVPINACIRAASVSGKGVFIPAGLWTHTHPDTLRSNVKIRGAGMGITVMFLSASGTSPMLTNDWTTPCGNAGISDITFNRNGTNTTHGWLLGNLQHFTSTNVQVICNQATVATAGAIAISAFNASARYRSRDVNFYNTYISGGGNFGIQYGNVIGSTIDGLHVDSTSRECVGMEPYNVSSEGGIVSRINISNVWINSPTGTTQAGSGTGLFIITSTSGGDVHRINGANINIKGGAIANQSGFSSYGCQKCNFSNIIVDSVGGIGVQISTSTGNLNDALQMDHVQVIGAGQDGGGSYWGMQVKDSKNCVFDHFDISGSAHVYGLIENGTSERNRFDNFKLIGNQAAYLLNTGRGHGSTAEHFTTDLSSSFNYTWTDKGSFNILDTAHYTGDSVNIGGTVRVNNLVRYATTQGSRITGSAGGFGLTDWHTVDSAITARAIAASTGANPTASLGLTAVNGVATTFMRSDAAPAISQAIVPTWTGVNTFSPVSTLSTGQGAGIQLYPQFTQTSTSTYAGQYMSLYDNGSNSGNKYLALWGTNTAAANAGTFTSKFNVTTAGAVTAASAITAGGTVSAPALSSTGTLAVSTTSTFTGVSTFTAQDVHNGGININGKERIKRTTVADVAYTTLSTDYVVAYTTLTATRAVTLASGTAGDVLILSDESGNAGTFPITITGTVDGATNKSISTAYGVLRLYCISGTTYKSF
jgi:hypothetical protein